jgi:Co/Zn/Cd efflux system component
MRDPIVVFSLGVTTFLSEMVVGLVSQSMSLALRESVSSVAFWAVPIILVIITVISFVEDVYEAADKLLSARTVSAFFIALCAIAGSLVGSSTIQA